MNAADAGDKVLRDYLDALLETPPLPSPSADADSAATPGWRLCTLGRLQLLLPNDSVGRVIPCAGIPQAPADWHLARMQVDGVDWQVAELVRCIAPGLATPPVETLIPVTGCDWMLAVPGCPETLSLPADAIQWRPHRSSRAWLAGMSCDGRYMALDVHILVQQLAATLGAGVEDASP